MSAQIHFDIIRPVIEAIADLLCCHGMSSEDDGIIRNILTERGFDLELIRAAEGWCDRVQASESLVDILSVFVPTGNGARISSPLEKVSVSDDVWKIIENCRSRGVITVDMAERLLESARALDTRDWDDKDVRDFFVDACVANALPSTQAKLELAFQGNFKNLYC